jgi:membrane protease YdiL (CAAX protease family)
LLARQSKIAPMLEPPPIPTSRAWLRPALLKSWTEFVIVAALLMALPICSSTIGALHGSSSHFVQLLLTDNHMLWTIFWEATVLAVFFAYLAWRGWKPADFHIGLGWRTSGQGVGLLLLAYLGAVNTLMSLIALAYFLRTNQDTAFSFLLSLSPHLQRHTIHISWLVIIVAMIINAFLEELVCMGYIFNQLAARRGPRVALVVTVFLRMACHTYQDPIHLAGIGVLFSIFALWYWKSRRLWPLIFAHILLDLGSTTFIKLNFG